MAQLAAGSTAKDLNGPAAQMNPWEVFTIHCTVIGRASQLLTNQNIHAFPVSIVIGHNWESILYLLWFVLRNIRHFRVTISPRGSLQLAYELTHVAIYAAGIQ
ncbi:hypothetical protein M406DRAFT_329445 [Cryphonectria parasitica EP155]|uniref:Uncharacterized protein n=1 Tax=Cryphonectria parasitica (strain ATCC 38755 / EP155) TaxID=660469 RepID=A0A9P5CPU8_CRYP1|nr:uncharacterized protein M406DRAFT_329445 [Cryphonectria parasitica EP155]KAF3765546.1 hypothetical protein M406DRAFT_329445 [Cryphonectria parasitica EP155]